MKQEIALTDEQSSAVAKIRAFLEDPDKREFLFTGPAGSGKTFTLRFALDEWKNRKDLVAGATISHAARQVLEHSIGDIAKCYTILQLLALRPVYGSTGRQYSEIKNKVKPIKYCMVIIIDECSMLDEFLLTKIRKYAAINSKIIFTGDSRQLPPVGDKDMDSSVFRIKDSAELTKSQRFNGPIGTGAQYYRDYVDYVKEYGKRASMMGLRNFIPIVDEVGSRVVFTKDREYFNYSAKEYIKACPKDTRILCFKNDLIDSYNDTFREMMYGAIQDTICKGEQVVLNGPYKTGGQYPKYFHNGEIIEVEDISYNYKTISFSNAMEVEDYQQGLSKVEYKVYNLHVRVEGEMHILHHIHPDSYIKFFNTKRSLKEIAIDTKRASAWVNYRMFKEAFVDFSYLYAQSSHKAQGQSIDHVFVLADDILSTNVSDETKIKSLYVAATRAKKSLYVLM